MSMPKKKTRLTIYALVIIFAVGVAGFDGAQPELVSGWVDQGAKLAGAAAALLAMLNPKEDQDVNSHG